MTESFRAWPKLTIAEQMTRSSSSSPMPRMKLRSIFSVSTGNAFRNPAEESPIPKSSSAMSAL
jgi:hypothetical protein